jgi:hypothetical protein
VDQRCSSSPQAAATSATEPLMLNAARANGQTAREQTFARQKARR